MRHSLTLLMLLCATSAVTLDAQTRKGELYGYLVVIDPGHGGNDPGSSRIHDGKRVTEDEYVYDVSLRVARLIRNEGGLARLTTKSSVGERNTPANIIFPDERTEKFTLDGSIVEAGVSGLSKRVQFGNKLAKKYPKHKQIWISIHFDVVGKLTDVYGIRIVCTDSARQVVKRLEKSIDDANRLRNRDPVVESGDKDHGMRNLFVLGPRNKIADRVLIELGNFNNDADVWRIRDPKVRESYATAIVNGLK